MCLILTPVGIRYMASFLTWGYCIDVGVISMITGSLRATRSRDPPSARALVWLRPTTPSLRGRVNKSFTHFCTSATWVMTYDTCII